MPLAQRRVTMTHNNVPVRPSGMVWLVTGACHSKVGRGPSLARLVVPLVVPRVPPLSTSCERGGQWLPRYATLVAFTYCRVRGACGGPPHSQTCTIPVLPSPFWHMAEVSGTTPGQQLLLYNHRTVMPPTLVRPCTFSVSHSASLATHLMCVLPACALPCTPAPHLLAFHQYLCVLPCTFHRIACAPFTAAYIHLVFLGLTPRSWSRLQPRAPCMVCPLTAIQLSR